MIELLKMKATIIVLFTLLITGSVYFYILGIPIEDENLNIIIDEIISKNPNIIGKQESNADNISAATLASEEVEDYKNRFLPWHSRESDVKIPISNYTILFALGVMIFMLRKVK